MTEPVKLTVSDFVAVCNQTLDFSFAGITVEGEVSSFKISQGKWVFFDLKDETSSISCFMTLYQMSMPLEDGMKTIVQGVPKLTNWGKFSFTVQKYLPVGAGNIKKSFELLKAKLEKEGLFDPAKKRPLPRDLSKIGVISSTDAAGYSDFIKILNARWGGLELTVAHTQVQGLGAAEQIMRALAYFNQRAEVEIIAIIRGGGSADDLAVFNDENLIRAIAASRIPVITGIGHERDESLADLAADLRGSTPSNVAEMITRDKSAEIAQLHTNISRLGRLLSERLNTVIGNNRANIENLTQKIFSEIDYMLRHLDQTKKVLSAVDPEKVLKQGYAILSGKISTGNVVKITTLKQEINAEVKNVQNRKH